VPVLKNKYLRPKEFVDLHTRCFSHFYFRKEYLFSNARLIWPAFGRFMGKWDDLMKKTPSAHRLEGVDPPAHAYQE
ncbi:MAG: hypothetical protein ACWGMZ_08595, partial [Thermoguttaceae bacterium]